MKNSIKYMGVLVIGIIFSCSKSDEAKTVTVPEVGYNQSVYQASFHTEGNTVAPTIEWNGDVGLFSLQNAIPGVSIDFNTGVVSWNGALPIGENDINVLAVNEAGASTVNIRLIHEFSGNFIGEVDFNIEGYNPFPFLVDFNANGSGILTINGSTSNPGFWTLAGVEIHGQYIFEDEPTEPYFIEGQITNTPTEAFIEGFYGTAIDENSGTFRVDIQEAQ